MMRRELPAAQKQGADDDVTAPLLENSADALGGGPEKSRLGKAWACLTFLPRSAWNSGVFCMSVSMVMYSFVWVLTKELSLLSIPVFQAVFTRGLFGMVVTGLLCKSKGIQVYGPRKMYGWLTTRGSVGAVAMIFIYSAMYLLPVGDACALQLLCTVFVVFFSWVFGWERGSMMAAFGAVCCTLGAILVSNPPFLHGGNGNWSSKRLLGIGMSLCGALLAGMAYSLISRIGKSVHPFSTTMWFHTPSMLFSAIPLLASFPASPVIFLTWQQGLSLLGMSFLAFAGQLMLTRSYQLCKPTTAAALQTTSVVYSYILGFLLLGESISYFAMGGTALIGVGLVIVAEGKRRAKAAEMVENDLENPENRN